MEKNYGVLSGFTNGAAGFKRGLKSGAAVLLAMSFLVVGCSSDEPGAGDESPSPSPIATPAATPAPTPEATPTPTPEPTPTPRPSVPMGAPVIEDESVFVDFEDGTLMGFDVRGTESEREAGTGVLSLSSDVARSGSYSLLITERRRDWNGPAIEIAPYVEVGRLYTVSFWVHAKSPDLSAFRLSTQTGDGTDGGRAWNNMISDLPIGVDDGWVEMSFEYSWDIQSATITVYIENDNPDAEYYVDDFSLIPVGLIPANPGNPGNPGDPANPANPGDPANPGNPASGEWDKLTQPVPYARRMGEIDDFHYELWSERRDPERDTYIMQLTGGGTFTCEWSGLNILFRTGKRLGSTMPYADYGVISIEYAATHNITRGDVSYLTAYGWTQNPLVEWYVVENHGRYKPPGGAGYRGDITIDGARYEVYTDTRVDKPSIEGTRTFTQVFSVRAEGTTSGKITLSDHFKAWEGFGIDMSGNMYEVAMCIEGWNSAGTGSIDKYILTIGNSVYGTSR
ncbi:MAG: glycoside hydrolase family 11 protein [Oscillospiraceae bacterium]|nr:glycoside hydrolase family 11 protein [Oscillospiraceae bacterium]